MKFREFTYIGLTKAVWHFVDIYLEEAKLISQLGEARGWNSPCRLGGGYG